MNIEELENKIKELQEELEKIKAEKTKRWRADRMVNTTYYALTNELDVYTATDNNDKKDKKRYKYHNYFKTKEEAQAVADNIKTHIELIEIAEELNTEPIDWQNQERRNFFISYDTEDNVITLDWNYTIKNANVIYCTNSSFRDEAIERIGEERLIRYLKG